MARKRLQVCLTPDVADQVTQHQKRLQAAAPAGHTISESAAAADLVIRALRAERLKAREHAS